MPSYVRIVHRGRGFNVRVELPDGSTRLVNVNDLQNWTQVERNADATPFVRTRHTASSAHEAVESAPAERNYIRILHRGRGHHVRLLLPDGTTYLARTEDLPNWTYVGDTNAEIPTLERANISHGFVNPTNQADRIYDNITRRGSRNTTVQLQNGERVHVPNELMSTWLRRGSSAYVDWDESNNYPNGREMRHLTFGVELEFVANPDKFDQFCDAMIQAVGSTKFSRPNPDNLTYGQSSTTKWVLGYDGSVRSTRPREYKRGYELTSPILKFDEASKQELTTVLHLITTIFEGIVNKTCGTHVHVGNFTRIQNTYEFRNKVLNFQKNYGAFEEKVFDRLVSPSRKGNNNHYCKSCNTNYIDGRYHKMNAQNIFGFGTLENRQHQGTLEVKKIWSWMELNGKYMIKYFKNPSNFCDTYLSMEEFFEKIELSNEAQQFFFSRDAELN